MRGGTARAIGGGTPWVAKACRLAAIVAGDVAGYSRLIGADEEGTLARLRALFREAVQPTVSAHRGRVFKLMGDAFLAEFPSAEEAVRCALTLQQEVEQREPELPEETRVRLRIGVHLGDVVAEGGDLLGIGVNVAARLEGAAEPGGVAVSAAVYEAVRGRVKAGFADLGEQRLKNIDRPVRAFRAVAAPTAPERGAHSTTHPAEPGPALPDRPSLVVLPFQNMSGEPDQEYFADGMVEDITTALSQIRWLFVIARNSAFTYKGKAWDVRQVGRELGVRYVLEGSVRRAGNRVRITGQLVDAETGHHIWADRFDGALENVFDLQDHVTEAVAGAIEPSIGAAEIQRARRKPPESTDAYDAYLRALPLMRSGRREDSDQAVAVLRRAIDFDSSLTLARGFLAFAHASRMEAGWLAPGDHDEAVRFANSVVDDRGSDPTALALAARCLGYLAQDHARTRAAAERALCLNPHSAFVLGVSGWSWNYLARPSEAILLFRRAVRLSPLDPEAAYFHSGLAYAHLMLEQFGDALAFAQRAVLDTPGRSTQHRAVITALVSMDRVEEAREAATAYRAAAPGGARVLAELVERRFTDKRFTARMIAALRLVGLPE